MPYDKHTLELTLEELTTFASKNPNSDAGFVEALNVVRGFQRQGKSVVILWPSRKPVEVHERVERRQEAE